MPRRTPEPLQQYRGTTAQHAAYTGPVGEITVDTTKKTAVVHDGVTAGGHPLAKESTTITASNGVEISAGGTLGQNTTVSGVSASTSAPGVVQLNSATNSVAENLAATPKAVSDALQAAKDYADTAAGAAYTGTAPISVDANTREISVADATASTKGVVSVGTNLNVTNGAVSVATATTTTKGVMQVGTNLSVSGGVVSVPNGSASVKGVVQVGDNMTVNGGVVSVKPWTDYAADHTTVDPTTLQEDAIVVTDESIGSPMAVLAEIEQTVSNDSSKVPSSAAVFSATHPVLKGTRTSTGSWSITELEVGKPLYIFLDVVTSGSGGICSGLYVASGGIGGTSSGTAASKFWLGGADASATDVFITIPNSSTVVISVYRIDTGCTLSAFQ